MENKSLSNTTIRYCTGYSSVLENSNNFYSDSTADESNLSSLHMIYKPMRNRNDSNNVCSFFKFNLHSDTFEDSVYKNQTMHNVSNSISNLPLFIIN